MSALPTLPRSLGTGASVGEGVPTLPWVRDNRPDAITIFSPSGEREGGDALSYRALRAYTA